MPQTGTPPTQGADGLASGVNLNGDTKNGTGIASSAQESTKRLSQNSPRPYASLERYGNTSNKNDFQLSSVDNNYATFPREGSERSEFSAGGNVISYQRHGEPAGVNGDNSGFFGGSKVSMVDYNAPMYTSMQSSDRPSGPPGSVQPTSMNVQTGPVKTSEARVGVSAVSENIKTSDISSPEFACVRRKSATQPNILTPSKDLVNSTESNFAKPNTVPVLNTTPSLNHVPAMNETAQKQFNVKSGATVLNKSDRGPTQNGTEINRTPNTPAQSSIGGYMLTVQFTICCYQS
ncbi:hypothetical protein SARC_12332 [Sphaeroforma arctica JP610]|uniref:Uncharacterized protein n=1 Tax=Sphaeroforma arctica JP610 TaxID=667725 RepID=A0A0L0FEE8_9EUKA|nr:hypothetical protein SARC_12332 [Sphaeroforma arctica JP610]KNC75134.1 hypothetical protein SARC_12332 [Sphaeroforma arctica JP610]|eukprot:XP_014149036.1 hypothetical protein SARC_12332 [Sphaeroforma arctica JP610]